MAQVAGDRVDPGAERPLRVVGLRAPEQAQEDLLAYVLGGVAVAREQVREVDDPVPPPVDDGLERPQVPRDEPRRERLVGRRRRGSLGAGGLHRETYVRRPQPTPACPA